MKKLLAILAVCFVAVSCQWWHETFDSPEDCAKWYSEQIQEAYEDGDVEEAVELLGDFMEWYAGLDAADQAKVDRYAAGLDGANYGGGYYDDYDYDDDYGW